MIQRAMDLEGIKRLIHQFPVTAILGPRQSGKTTIARQFGAAHAFDLENPRDAAFLDQPQIALESLRGLILIDEVQRRPDLFPLLRFLVDSRPDQRYLLLGSASPDLLRQSSESLAGRIGYWHLGGFRLTDVGPTEWRRLWLRGGLPPSYIAESDAASYEWRQQYVSTFVERDLPQLGIGIPAPTMRRFWTMLSHYHGQVLNYADLARSFGVSDMSVRRYVEVLEGAFMVRLLRPWHVNLGKRLVKRPKLYVRDSGLLHALLTIRDERDLAAHNRLGASWEGFALDVAARVIGARSEDLHFWATHSGAEVDLFWQDRGRNWAVEVKYADAPRLTSSMASAVKDLDLAGLWVMYPGDKAYPLAPRVAVLPLQSIGPSWDYGELHMPRL